MPAPHIDAGMIASPEGGILSQLVIVETRHLLGQLEVVLLFFRRVGIDTLLSGEVDDVVPDGVAIDDLVRALLVTVILVDTTATVGSGNRLLHSSFHHRLLHTLLLGNEVEVVLGQHG